ncbi:MAG: 2Fe-2S iron-sulfur cluster-binding protein, partial [Anaerovorax sp.]
MVKLIIDGQYVSVPDGTTILEAAESCGIHIPHLCYLKGINDIGACRVCIVERKGTNKLITACNNVVEQDMEIFTNSPKVRATRKANVQLILSDHDCMCAICIRSGNCSLQTIANDLGIIRIPYHKIVEKNRWDQNFPLVRDASKCIKCMRCIQVCDKIQGLGVWDVTGSGFRTTVGVSGNKKIQDADCALCGQCITHCPVGALRERNDMEKMFGALGDPKKIAIVQIAPAIRAAWGEGIGLYKEEATLGRLVSAL